MFDNMSLRMKLFVLSGLAMAALIIAVITGTAGIRSGIRGVDEIGHRRLPSVIALQGIREAQVALKSSTYETGLWENDTDAQDQFEGIAKDKRQQWVKAEEAWKAYEAIPKSAEETELWGRFVKEWETWKKIDQQIIGLITELAANKDAAQQKSLFQKYYMLGGQQRKSYLAAEKLLTEAIDLNAKIVAAQTQEAEQATQLAQTLMLVIGIGALAVTAVLAATMTASIMRQMGGDPAQAVEISRRIANGDLGGEIPVKPGDDSSLIAAMAYMRQHLRGLIGEVLTSAEELSRSARALAQDVMHVAASGEEGAQAASSTAKAVDDISDRISHIGQSAETALKLSDQAGNLSHQGHEVVGNAAAEMERISESVRSSSELVQKLGDYSSKISEIVNVIREISDQTNLLALNAAIEAARAGEQGRGFAVVADEVRKLAERTGQSTQEISTMIGNIQQSVGEAVSSMQAGRQRVDDGVQLAREASSTMENIQSGAHEARSAVNEINASLQEGSRSLRDIGTLMGDIVRMIDDNARSLATMNESADSIDRLATKLADSAHRFHL
jgi:methyl-accepting chemotaxis protein